MFGNQIGILSGKHGSQRRPRPLPSALRRPNPPRQRQYPEFLKNLAQQAKRSLPMDEEDKAGDPFPRKTLRRTAVPTPRSFQESDKNVVVITDSDDTEEEDGSDEGSETDDIMITQPLTSKDFADNMNCPAPESPDEGYGSFSSGLGLEDDTRKGSRRYGAGFDEVNDRNGMITLPPRLNKVSNALVAKLVRVRLTAYKQTTAKNPNTGDQEARAEARERSRRLREAARAKEISSSPYGSEESTDLANLRDDSMRSMGNEQTAKRSTDLDLKSRERMNVIYAHRPSISTAKARVPIESASRTIGTNINRIQRPFNSETSQPSSGQRSHLNSTHESDDVVSAAWIQESLARTDLEKKRTRFLSGSLLPEPQKNRQKTPHMPIRGYGGGSIMVPVRASREDKEKEKDAERVRLVGEKLTSYLKKDPGNERTQKEYEEYERCKEKLSRGETLVAAERNRMGELKRNAERREYNFQVKAPQKSVLSASKVQKQRVEAKPPKDRPVPPKRAETKEDEETRRIGIEKALEAFKGVSDGAELSQRLDCSPTNGNLGFGIKEYEKQDDDSSKCDDEDKRIEGTRKTVAGKGLIKEIVQQREMEETSGTPVSEEESSSSEDDGIEEDEPVWQFDVYRREFGAGNCDCDPVLLGTYLDRRRAEGVVRAEISNIQASLQELCEFEFSCKFEQNSIRGQTISFSSGRSIELFIEKDVSEGVERLKRHKKARLPTKHYLVIEETIELEPEVDDLFETEKSLATKGNVYKESYIFKQDANKQASKFFVAHQAAHLEGDERFDIGIIGSIDTEGRRYLHELEAGERLFDKTEVLPPGKEGKKTKVHIWVQEQLLRGPRN